MPGFGALDSNRGDRSEDFGSARPSSAFRAASHSDLRRDGPTIAIVGGGASGALLALRLLRMEQSNPRVILIDRSGTFGRGLAYSTPDVEHLLNVAPTKMSAYADDPDHFWRWLRTTGRVPVDSSPFVFVARRHFGDYLGTLLEEVHQRRQGRLELVTGEVKDVRQSVDRAEVILNDGVKIAAEIAVLATGHGSSLSVRALPPIARAERRPVLILGSGLSMVDGWLSLRSRGFADQFIVLSRHGLVPQPQSGAAPLPISDTDIPIGKTPLTLLRWLRQHIDQAVADGRDWRAVTDSLRPFAQSVWAAWTVPQRRQFLIHGRSYWSVRRHRLAPQVHARLMAELQAGTIVIVAAKTHGALPGAGAQLVAYRRRGRHAIETVEVAEVLDCRGLARDWRTEPGLLARLIADGHVRTDPFRLGIDVTQDGWVIDGAGAPSPRLGAIGPLTRGALFEIDAIPDIRAQCASIAAELRARAISLPKNHSRGDG